MAATAENGIPYPRRLQYQCAGHWRDWMAGKETYIQCGKIGTKLCPCHLVAVRTPGLLRLIQITHKER